MFNNLFVQFRIKSGQDHLDLFVLLKGKIPYHALESVEGPFQRKHPDPGNPFFKFPVHLKEIFRLLQQFHFSWTCIFFK